MHSYMPDDTVGRALYSALPTKTRGCAQKRLEWTTVDLMLLPYTGKM